MGWKMRGSCVIPRRSSTGMLLGLIGNNITSLHTEPGNGVGFFVGGIGANGAPWNFPLAKKPLVHKVGPQGFESWTKGL